MNAVAIIAILALLGFALWVCLAEAPSVARTREVDEDESYGPIERGPDDEF